MAIFGMAGGERIPLTEIFQLVDGHAFHADQMQQRIEQHGAMTRRQDETVPIRPMRILRVKIHKTRKQDGGDISGPHWQARMARFGLFHPIHSQRTNGICHYRALIAHVHELFLEGDEK